MLDGPRTALAFLTRLPGGSHPDDDTGLTRSVPWFPVVGVLVGALGAAAYAATLEVVSPLAAATVAVAATALITGGFHEDGLADSFDGLAGGWDREQRLRILKDSRHGTFGVLSLVLITVLKVTGLAEMTGWHAAGALVVAHSLGRSGAVALMRLGPTARRDGLGADYTRGLGVGPALAGSASGVAVAVAVFGVDGLVLVGVVVVVVAAMGWWAVRRIGGVTGDVLGAAEQLAEAAVLVLAPGLTAF